MTGRVRIAAEALAFGLFACLSQSTNPKDSVAIQKSPIILPGNVVLPSTMMVQPWGGVPTGVPTIDVSLDESRVERAAIATGLNANVVSSEAAKRLKLTSSPGSVKVEVMDSTATAEQAELQRFRAATLDLPKLIFAVADVPAMLSPHPHPGAPAAWLGIPFLSAFQVILDPDTQSIILQKPNSPLPRRPQTSIVPMKLRDNRPFVHVTIPGVKPFDALLDTTSPGTVIPTAIGESLKLKPNAVESISWREGKIGRVARVIVPKLTIGKADWITARVVYLTSESSKEYDRNFAVIGMDFIGQFRMVLDFKRSQLSLTPRGTGVEPVQPGSAGAQ